MHEPRTGDRVVVGMSGGVDSSVAAALLVDAGYRVVGITMRLRNDVPGSGHRSPEDSLDARRVAASLGIAFYVMDLREAFSRTVVESFVADYVAGRTPNPCTRCNPFVKFASLQERARELDAEWIATGHYARVRHDPETGWAELHAGADPSRDQSYFLFGIGPAVLARTIFPVGELTKADVRAHARMLQLPVADKPDSQEVCFAPKGDYASFVAQFAQGAPARSGGIVDEQGRVLGQHDGIHQFTIGQRRGLRLSAGKPLYVTGIDAATATVRVGPQSATVAAGLLARGVNWLNGGPVPAGTLLQIKIRSRCTPTAVTIGHSTPESFVAWARDGLPAVTPGQAAVLYDGDRVIGGGWIERSLSGEG